MAIRKLTFKKKLNKKHIALLSVASIGTGMTIPVFKTRINSPRYGDVIIKFSLAQLIETGWNIQRSRIPSPVKQISTGKWAMLPPRQVYMPMPQQKSFQVSRFPHEVPEGKPFLKEEARRRGFNMLLNDLYNERLLYY